MFKFTKRFLLALTFIALMVSSNSVINADFSLPIEDYSVFVRDIDDFSSIKYEDTLSYFEMRDYLTSIEVSSEVINDFDTTYNLHTKTRSRGQLRYSLLGFDTSTTSIYYKTQFRASAGMIFYPDNNGVFTNPSSIETLEAAHIYTGAGSKCIFGGTIYFKLVNYNTVYWSYYGDLYKAGQVSWTVGGSIGVGKGASINGSISNGSGFIKNISYSGQRTLVGIS